MTSPAPSYREIPLTQGQVAIVDETDYERLSQWKWHAYWHDRSKSYYAKRSGGKGKRQVFMHRFILSPPEGFQTDHINHDTLDNRRSNLRAATGSQNSQNRRRRSNNLSGYKGVSWWGHKNKWGVMIWVDKRNIFIGLFDDKEEAARRYDEEAIKRFGDFAYLNFPHHPPMFALEDRELK